MSDMNKIAVYCASSDRVATIYKQSAFEVGAHIAKMGSAVVYGGGGVGLMNQVAEGALNHGGQVLGVITEQLEALEVGRKDLTELHVVPSMRERKAMMARLADGFVCLPGGYGTLEELFEVVTMTQLRIHLKPVGLLNVEGYYDSLLAFIDHAVSEGFIRACHRPLIVADTEISALLDKMSRIEVPEFEDWL